VRVHATSVPDEHDGVARSRVIVRHARARWLIATRRAAWLTRPAQFPRAVDADPSRFPSLLHEQRMPMRRSDADANPLFEDGKCINVALAAPALDGIRLDPGVTFSFWRTVGPPRRSLGFRHGMELRGGCVVPSLGGGLCLLSNALFRAAADLGWVIVERHGHTMEAVPSDDQPWGVDATIAWPYVDLRLAVPAGDPPARLHVRVIGDDLELQVWGGAPVLRRVELVGVDDRVEIVDGQRVRQNRIVRRTTGPDRVVTTEVIATNAKRLLAPADLGRSCLTCQLDDCAGRITIR
jgi:vancomycin resistance protein VanW